MATSGNRKLWATTREPNLLKNLPSGRYYGRFTFSGKQKWLNLDTKTWSVAKLPIEGGAWDKTSSCEPPNCG